MTLEIHINCITVKTCDTATSAHGCGGRHARRWPLQKFPEVNCIIRRSDRILGGNIKGYYGQVDPKESRKYILEENYNKKNQDTEIEKMKEICQQRKEDYYCIDKPTQSLQHDCKHVSSTHTCSLLRINICGIIVKKRCQCI